MFNKGYRNRCIERYEEASKKYSSSQKKMMTTANDLYVTRKELKPKIDEAWEFLNSLRNKPEELDTEIKNIKIETTRFKELENIIKEEARNSEVKAKGSAAAGAALGAGVVALGPGVAMGVAMTFGTASTGTAIASLTGAAATKAAIAWLGGGALVAGGGGIAAGNALLALAGPIGWGIGIVSVVGSGLFANSKNKKIAEEANYERTKLEAHIKTAKGLTKEIKLIGEEISEVSTPLNDLLNICVNNEKNFIKMNEDEKNQLASLVNNTKAASKLLNKGVGENK